MSRPIALPTKLKRFRSERFSWLRLLLALLPILAGCAQHSSACSKGVSISGCGRASGGKCNECDAVKASSVGGRGGGGGEKAEAPRACASKDRRHRKKDGRIVVQDQREGHNIYLLYAYISGPACLTRVATVQLSERGPGYQPVAGVATTEAPGARKATDSLNQ